LYGMSGKTTPGLLDGVITPNTTRAQAVSKLRIREALFSAQRSAPRFPTLPFSLSPVRKDRLCFIGLRILVSFVKGLFKTNLNILGCRDALLARCERGE